MFDDSDKYDEYDGMYEDAVSENLTRKRQRSKDNRQKDKERTIKLRKARKQKRDVNDFEM